MIRSHHRKHEREEDPPDLPGPVPDELQDQPETQVVPPYPMGVAVLRAQKQRHRDHVTAGGISIYT